MIDDSPCGPHGPNADGARAALAGFLAELDAGREALDEAFHFDDRAAVKPAYDALMRLADTHGAVASALKAQRAPSADANGGGDDEAIRTVEEILAVLRDMAGGAGRYHAGSGRLARLQSQLADALARMSG